MLTRTDALSELQPQTSEQETTSRWVSHVSLFQRAWPIAVIVLSAVVTLAWVCVVGYELIHIASSLF